jgi:hypothetical protein
MIEFVVLELSYTGISTDEVLVGAGTTFDVPYYKPSGMDARLSIV